MHKEPHSAAAAAGQLAQLLESRHPCRSGREVRGASGVSPTIEKVQRLHPTPQLRGRRRLRGPTIVRLRQPGQQPNPAAPRSVGSPPTTPRPTCTRESCWRPDWPGRGVVPSRGGPVRNNRRREVFDARAATRAGEESTSV